MRHCLRLLTGFAICWCCLWGPAYSAPAPKVTVRLEFRRAETKPAEGLEEVTVPKSGEKIYLHKRAEITAADVASASIEKDGDRAFLKLVFTKEGNTKLEKLTKEHRDKPLAVLLDGKVLVAPVISSTLTEQAVLSGIEQADLEKIVKGISGK